jgi:hypothetical protein
MLESQAKKLAVRDGANDAVTARQKAMVMRAPKVPRGVIHEHF